MLTPNSNVVANTNLKQVIHMEFASLEINAFLLCSLQDFEIIKDDAIECVRETLESRYYKTTKALE